MKRIVGILVCLLAITGVASANSVIIPFFVDGGNKFGEAPQGSQSYIGVMNLEPTTYTCMVFYTDTNGQSCTPLPLGVANTFEIGPYSAKTFRPTVNDGLAENSEIPDASQVLAAAYGTAPGLGFPSSLKLTDTSGDGVIDGGGGGGCIITSTGEIVGNVNSVFHWNTNSNAVAGSYPGFLK